LEIGIVIGIALVVCGLVTSTYAVGFWGSRGFGSLDPTISLRIVIPAVALLLVGLQVLLSRFCLAVLW
ncbi:MAG: hypothetical protein MN733_26600, partial [Nitrososphaera sp.]|nr:hypothetical protein [Nitrososphaera sp.]